MILLIIAVVVVLAVVFLVRKNTSTKQKDTASVVVPRAENLEETSIPNAIKNSMQKLQEILSSAPELSYEEAMKYFITHKKDSVDIAKGAMLKEKTGDSFTVTQVFLNNEDNIVEKDGHLLGCKRKVSRLDKELLDLFGNKDLIIVE